MPPSRHIYQLSALKDNFNFILRDDIYDQTFVIDPSEGEPTLSFLTTRNWKLNGILCTHHHWDHTGGNLDLQRRFDCPVYAHISDKDRTPGFTIGLSDGDLLDLAGFKFKILHIPGHTSGQIAFWAYEDHIVFVGDTLFNFGCGRIFEGTPEQMHQSLAKLKKLPEDTSVYCGHNYTLKNLEFCLAKEPEEAVFQNTYKKTKQLEALGESTVPFRLGDQITESPFLTDDFLIFRDWREHRNKF